MVLSLIYACKDTTFSQNSRVFSGEISQNSRDFRLRFHKIPRFFDGNFTKFQKNAAPKKGCCWGGD
jgi:hypothetical protein